MRNAVRSKRRAPHQINQLKVHVKDKKNYMKLEKCCTLGQFSPEEDLQEDRRNFLIKKLCDAWTLKPWSEQIAAKVEPLLVEIMASTYAHQRFLINSNSNLNEICQKYPCLSSQPYLSSHFNQLTGKNLNEFSEKFLQKAQNIVKYFKIQKPQLVPPFDMTEDLKAIWLIANHFRENIAFIFQIDDVRKLKHVKIYVLNILNLISFLDVRAS